MDTARVEPLDVVRTYCETSAGTDVVPQLRDLLDRWERADAVEREQLIQSTESRWLAPEIEVRMHSGVGASGYGSVNSEIINNATITNLKGQALGIGTAGNVTGTFSVTGNTANPSNILGSDALGINTDKRTISGNTVATPTLNAVVSNNTISGYDQYGIHSLGAPATHRASSWTS